MPSKLNHSNATLLNFDNQTGGLLPSSPRRKFCTAYRVTELLPPGEHTDNNCLPGCLEQEHQFAYLRLSVPSTDLSRGSAQARLDLLRDLPTKYQITDLDMLYRLSSSDLGVGRCGKGSMHLVMRSFSRPPRVHCPSYRPSDHVPNSDRMLGSFLSLGTRRAATVLS